MFEKMKNLVGQFQMMQRLLKDENFRAFMSHPKVQEVLRDPELQELIKTKDSGKVMTHPKLAALLQDPEVTALTAKLNPKNFL